MQRKVPENWWFSGVPVSPAPANLKAQLGVAAAFYLLMYGIPGIADLAFGKGPYLNLYTRLSDLIFAICSSAAILVLFSYFVRVEGGPWRLFWNRGFVPNLICLALVPVVLTLSDWGTDRLFKAIQTSSPYFSGFEAPPEPRFSTVHWYYFLPATFAYAATEEIVVRSYLITRVRQIGGGVAQAVLFSTLIYSVFHFAWGVDVFAETLVSGIILGLIYARWGGLAGFILGHIVWELSNYLQ